MSVQGSKLTTRAGNNLHTCILCKKHYAGLSACIICNFAYYANIFCVICKIFRRRLFRFQGYWPIFSQIYWRNSCNLSYSNNEKNLITINQSQQKMPFGNVSCIPNICGMLLWAQSLLPGAIAELFFYA